MAMTSTLSGQLAVAAGTASFDEEMRQLLRRRSRALFWIGLLGTSATLVAARAFAPEPVLGGLRDWQTVIHVLTPLSFGAALAAIRIWHRTRRQLELTTFWVLAFNLVSVILTLTIMYPGSALFLPVALLLFVHAAFIPCVPSQVMLAGAAVLAVSVGLGAAPSFSPELAGQWAGASGAFERAWGAFGVLLLAATSVLVSRNLYALHHAAHRARRLGNYTLEDVLGEGGMGVVYRARHALICRPTAVKVLSRVGTESADRFEREVQLSASLSHPNTITIFDYGRTVDGTFYYAMEYLDGLDLQRLVERFGAIPARRASHLLLQACGALAEAHGRGIVHRDLKPSNLFLTHRGGVFDFIKVLDFGLARQETVARSTSRTAEGILMGTPRYLAPETLYGAARADARSDIYSLGGVAYWLLAGRAPFEGTSAVDLIVDHVKTEPSLPSRYADAPIPPLLEEVVMRCLEKDPDRRYQDAGQLAAALRSACPVDWTPADAGRWWSEHMPESTVIDRCDPCFSPGSEIDPIDRRPSLEGAAG